MCAGTHFLRPFVLKEIQGTIFFYSSSACCTGHSRSVCLGVLKEKTQISFCTQLSLDLIQFKRYFDMFYTTKIVFASLRRLHRFLRRKRISTATTCPQWLRDNSKRLRTMAPCSLPVIALHGNLDKKGRPRKRPQGSALYFIATGARNPRTNCSRGNSHCFLSCALERSARYRPYRCKFYCW